MLSIRWHLPVTDLNTATVKIWESKCKQIISFLPLEGSRMCPVPELEYGFHHWEGSCGFLLSGSCWQRAELNEVLPASQIGELLSECELWTMDLWMDQWVQCTCLWLYYFENFWINPLWIYYKLFLFCCFLANAWKWCAFPSTRLCRRL